MSNQAKTAPTPKIRFPEFRGRVTWRGATLGEVVDFKAGTFVPASDISDTSADGLFPCYGGNGVRGYTRSFSHDGTYSLVGRQGALCGNVQLAQHKFHATEHALVANPKSGVSTQWLYYGLTHLELNQYATGQAQPGLSVDVLEKVPLAVPNDSREQDKIAECLTSLDAVISAHDRWVEALKAHKRGLIEQLFPHEAESRPRLRFAEFRDAPGWQSDKAGTLFTNRSERGLHTLPVYSVTMTDGLVSRASLDRRVDDLADATANKRAYERDIVYNTMRMWQGACGVANTDCMLSPAYVVLAPKDEVHSPFFGYLFKQPHMLRLFTAHSRGLTEDRLRLYFDDFCDVPVQLPSFNEQRRIADCLTTFDRTIQTEMSRLDELNAHKRALMYQLFPSAEAV